MANASLNIGMIGFGNIGTGVVAALAANQDTIGSLLPHPICIARITDIDTTTKRACEYDPALLSTDTDALLNDPEIHVILELTGKIDFARDLIEKALKAGKHVVTANKALMALYGMDLLKIAVEHGVCLLFEAAVAGGVPLIRTLHQGLAANKIQAVRGIINGTANYILTRMTEQGLDFTSALEEAKALGYAEPDPTFDIEGHDTAHKLAILATLCFSQDVRFHDVYLEGITEISALDIAFAKESNYVIKLVGISKRHEDGSIEARVHPALLPKEARLASIGGVYNAVRIDGNLTGSVILSGRGAGPEPTASAIISDLMALASGKAEGGLQREMRLCMPRDKKKIRPMNELETRYCIRLTLRDVPGALAQIFTCLGRHGVSIESIKQPGVHDETKSSKVMVMTHQAREAQVQQALAEVTQLEVSTAKPFILRIEEMG